jgi:FtsP/CotA-like multicopper oxidase with cupredoxin domain
MDRTRGSAFPRTAAQHDTADHDMYARGAGAAALGASADPGLGLRESVSGVPLIIIDRNFDTDAAGNLTGQLLHKVGILFTEPEKVTLPFLGPFALVNGVIWPHLDVDARWYRFRVLNASNSRFYRLALHDGNGAVVAGALRQIGTDGGLRTRA